MMPSARSLTHIHGLHRTVRKESNAIAQLAFGAESGFLSRPAPHHKTLLFRIDANGTIVGIQFDSGLTKQALQLFDIDLRTCAVAYGNLLLGSQVNLNDVLLRGHRG